MFNRIRSNKSTTLSNVSQQPDRCTFCCPAIIKRCAIRSDTLSSLQILVCHSEKLLKSCLMSSFLNLQLIWILLTSEVELTKPWWVSDTFTPLLSTTSHHFRSAWIWVNFRSTYFSVAFANCANASFEDKGFVHTCPNAHYGGCFRERWGIGDHFKVLFSIQFLRLMHDILMRKRCQQHCGRRHSTSCNIVHCPSSDQVCCSSAVALAYQRPCPSPSWFSHVLFRVFRSIPAAQEIWKQSV